jgi:hypothetical protein
MNFTKNDTIFFNPCENKYLSPQRRSNKDWTIGPVIIDSAIRAVRLYSNYIYW